MARPMTLAEVAERRAQGAAALWKPLGEFLDAFYDAAADRPAMLKDEPLAEIAPQEAAFLAATAEHLGAVYGVIPPAWTAAPRFFLDTAYWPHSLGRTSETIHFAESPVAFRRRFIFTEGRPLRRKHGPYPVSA